MRLRRLLALFAAVTPLLVFVTATTASAATICPAGYKYGTIFGAQHGNTFYGDTTGMVGYISTDTVTLPDSNYVTAHAVTYISEQTAYKYVAGAPVCGLDGSCWAQVGYGLGNAGGNVSNHLLAYVEDSDLYGYRASYLGVSLTQETYYEDFFDGRTVGATPPGVTTPQTGGAWDMYVCPTNAACSYASTSWIPFYLSGSPEASLEDGQGVTAHCPAWAPREVFGESGNGVSLQKGVGNPFRFWSASGEQVNPHWDVPYNNALLPPNPDWWSDYGS